MREPRSVYVRRRSAAFGVLAAVVFAILTAIAAGGDDESGPAAGEAETPAQARPAQLPRGGRTIFPRHRVVAFYGAPQHDELGTLGIGSPEQAARRLERRTRTYDRPGRPAIPAMELIAVIAANDPGEDDLWRTQQDGAVIDRYLRAARRARALLVLDIQPGHSDFLVEARRLERWLREPDVGLALDPEWHTPGVKPGTEIGAVTSEQVNAVSAWLANIVREEDLPEKLFVVHQFTSDMIRDKERVKERPGLAVTINVDGFGDRPNKIAKYRQFTSEARRFHDGLKLFFKEDVDLMKPRNVLALDPPPDLVVYE